MTDPGTTAKVRDYIIERVADRRFRPRVARTFSLDQIQRGYDYIRSNRPIGRTVVTL